MLVDRYVPGSGALGVSCDDHRGGRTAAEHLHHSGGTRSASVGGGAHSHARGFRAAQLRVDHPEVDGVSCADDMVAMGFLDGLRVQHLARVPQEVLVIGFETSPPRRGPPTTSPPCASPSGRWQDARSRCSGPGPAPASSALTTAATERLVHRAAPDGVPTGASANRRSNGHGVPRASARDALQPPGARQATIAAWEVSAVRTHGITDSRDHVGLTARR